MTSITDGKGEIINGVIAPGDIISEVNNAQPTRPSDILFGEKDSVVRLSVVSASGPQGGRFARGSWRVECVRACVPIEYGRGVLRRMGMRLMCTRIAGQDFQVTVMRNVPIRIWERWHRKEVLFPAQPALPEIPWRGHARLRTHKLTRTIPTNVGRLSLADRLRLRAFSQRMHHSASTSRSSRARYFPSHGIPSHLRQKKAQSC